MNIRNIKVRRYIYGVSVAALPLLIITGVITENVVPSILGMLGAILVPGLAVANTPTDGE